MELEFTERRTYDVHIYIYTEKISIRLTNVGLTQARPNYLPEHTREADKMLGNLSQQTDIPL